MRRVACLLIDTKLACLLCVMLLALIYIYIYIFFFFFRATFFKIEFVVRVPLLMRG